MAQSSFRNLHSIVTSMCNATDKWIHNIDKGIVTGVVPIDLCKTFDTVITTILLAKLPTFGISGIEK